MYKNVISTCPVPASFHPPLQKARFGGKVGIFWARLGFLFTHLSPREWTGGWRQLRAKAEPETLKAAVLAACPGRSAPAPGIVTALLALFPGRWPSGVLLD